MVPTIATPHGLYNCEMPATDASKNPSTKSAMATSPHDMYHQIEQRKSPELSKQFVLGLLQHSPHPSIRVPDIHGQNCFTYPGGQV